MYNDEITLFNRRKSRHGDAWLPSVLRGVNLRVDKSAALVKYGAKSADKAILNVRYAVVDGIKRVAGKIWLPPKAWGQRDESELSGSLTFTDGTAFDFFWAGAWPDESPIADGAYPDGFYNHMNERYDYVFKIASVGIYRVIPHFEITGA